MPIMGIAAPTMVVLTTAHDLPGMALPVVVIMLLRAEPTMRLPVEASTVVVAASAAVADSMAVAVVDSTAVAVVTGN
jgi:hypothetical protein